MTTAPAGQEVPAARRATALPARGMPWPDARRLAGEVAGPLAPRQLPLLAACWRVLADDMVALTDLPAADTSAMDGWAVAGRAPWQVVADLPAGRLFGRPLAAGECVRIATGAVVPGGTDAVVPVELSVQDASGVRPTGPTGPTGLLPRDHVRRTGEEARRGDVLVRAGTLVTPPVVGLAAAAGHDTLLVAPPAVIDVLVLGDELVDHGVPVPGRTRDALGPQLPAWLAAYGAPARTVRSLPDRLPDLVAALAGTDADVVVTTGGTSVGPRDHVPAAIVRVGGQVLVDGVDVKPGHPMLLAALPDGRWLVGLPGNPFAACAALVTLVGPLLERLHAAVPVPTVTARLASAEPGRPGDGHRLLPIRRNEDGDAVVLPSCGSAMLRGLAQATGLAVVPPNGAFAGDEVEYLPLPWHLAMAAHGSPRQGPPRRTGTAAPPERG